MQSVLIVVFEVLFLFFSSKWITQGLFSLTSLFFANKKLRIFLFSFVFFPGVVVHELSHFLMAKMLLVRTGKISLFPKIEEGNIKLGSVQVEKTGIIRRLLIGAAPLLGGGSVVSFAVWFGLSGLDLGLTLSSVESFLKTVIIIYLIFVIANTMFSSKKDMEGMVGLLIMIVILLGGVLFAGGGPFLMEQVLDVLHNKDVDFVLERLMYFLLFPLGMNGFFLLLPFIFSQKKI